MGVESGRDPERPEHADRAMNGRWDGWRWLAAPVVVAATVAWAGAAPPGTVEPIRPAPEIALTTTEGAAFRLSEHRGRIVLVTFGFTRCPDVCPLMLAKLAQLRARLGSAGPEIHVVFVTLDPDRDTPARLRDYVRGFDATFVGLTGTPRALAGTRDAYGVVAARRQPLGPSTYLLDHSAFAFAVDRAGQLRLMFPAGMSVEDMAQGLATLLYAGRE